MGFAQEIRDFTSGFQTGAKIVNDMEDRKAGREAALADTAYKARKEDREERKLKADSEYNRAKLAQQAASDAGRNKYYENALALRRRALEIKAAKPERDTRTAAERQEDELEEYRASQPERDFDNVLLPAMANGGLVPPVVDRSKKGDFGVPVEEAPAPAPVQASALPTEPAPVTPEVTPKPAAEERDYAQEARDAGVKQTLAEAQSGAAEPASALPTGKPAKSLYTKALTDEENKIIMQQIDPEGTLPDNLKQLSQLELTYKFWADKGDMKKASEAAQAILLRGKAMASQYGAAAEQEIQNGNTAKAAALLEFTYNNHIPDGKTVEVGTNGIAIFKDSKTGELVAEGKMTPQMLLEMATGLKNGPAYWEILGQAARKDFGPKERAPKDLKPMSSTDMEQIDVIRGRLAEMKDGDQLPPAVAELAYYIAGYGTKDVDSASSLLYNALLENAPGTGRSPFKIKPEGENLRVIFPEGEFVLGKEAAGAIEGVRRWYAQNAQQSALPTQ